MESERRALPERISGLWQLALNLRWTWHPEAREVFRRLDYPLWRLTSHNSVRMLHLTTKQQLRQAARDPAFIALYDAAIEGLGRALTSKESWWGKTYPGLPNRPIAYFSAEFALHQSLPIYAGGLGVLAGDHCKEASDLGIPLVGIGFMYPQGYFHQKINSKGQQEEVYEHLEWEHAPVEQVVAKDGKPCILSVLLGDRPVHVSLWCVRLGRVKIYLLDTSVKENEPADRELSARLYGGDRETRLKQEIILGIGGVRALRAMGAIEKNKDECRDLRPGRLLGEFLGDLRYAGRALRRSPRFAALAVVIMAIGIGANTAVFSVVNGVLLKSLPYPDADRIVVLRTAALTTGEINPLVTLANFRDWRAQSSAFEAMATYRSGDAPVTSVPTRLPCAALPVAPLAMITPSTRLPEIRFPSPGAVPPMKLLLPLTRTPARPRFGKFRVPLASVPM